MAERQENLEAIREAPREANIAPHPLPRKFTRSQRFVRHFYNPDTQQILGRTLRNWGQLGIFYGVFYGVLGAMCFGGFAIFLSNLEAGGPRWKLGESLIGTNPGLGFRPISPNPADGALIAYNTKNPQSIEKWVKLLDQFLLPYFDRKGNNIQQCDFRSYPRPNQVCTVNVKQFGPCNSKNKYGYNDNSPCVFIKLNKIYGWIPDFFLKPLKNMPQDLITHIKALPKYQREQIWISCNGEHPIDRENIEGFKYFPGPGFPGYYYPYTNIKNYLSPLIAVQIVNPAPNMKLSIECRVWAKNVRYNGGSLVREGSVQFEILKYQN